jgi:EpsI family protein
LHRPETCYPAQGFSIEGIARTTLALDRADPIAAQTFTAVRDTREEHLLYWTRISESFPLTTGEEYRAIFGGVLRGIVPDGVLVRFSTIDADKAQAMAALQEFAGALLAQSPEKLREILVGSVRAREISGTA